MAVTKKVTRKSETPLGGYVRVEYIAKLTGVEPMRVRQLTQKGVIKSEIVKGEAGLMYDLLPTVQALLAYYREKANKRSGSTESMEAEKLKRETAKRQLDELKLQKAQGLVIEIEVIEKVIGGIFMRLRSGLLSLPMGVAPLLRDISDVNEISEIIKSRLYEILNELSEFDIDTLKSVVGMDLEPDAD